MSLLDHVLVKPGSGGRLRDRDPAGKLGFSDKDAAKEGTKRDAEEIDRLQDILYAEGKRALLVVLQGTDTSGKDGTIRDVFNATGPLGVARHRLPRSRARRSARTIFCGACTTPARARGTIGIFNRSHYEDVLVVKVQQARAGRGDRGALRPDQRLREDARRRTARRS